MSPAAPNQYQKAPTAKATVAEAAALARGASLPATAVAKGAFWIAVLAFLMSAVALAVALRR